MIAGLVNGQDVWMIERRCGTRFVKEAAQSLRVAANSGRNTFTRDRPASRIDRLIDLTHATAAEQFKIW